VRRAGLDDVLPPDTARVTPDGRRAQLLDRFHAIQRQRLGV
jgi:hypothetical protein